MKGKCFDSISIKCLGVVEIKMWGKSLWNSKKLALSMQSKCSQNQQPIKTFALINKLIYVLVYDSTN